MLLACARKKYPPVMISEQVQEALMKVAPMKRKNFSAEEINFLKSLIQKYRPNQIENKKTDTANLGEKQRIWESITAEFNSHFQDGEETSVKQLRKLWDNLKTRRKNELLRERLVDDDSINTDIKPSMCNTNCDEVSDSLDSSAMSVDFPPHIDENNYISDHHSPNWTLPIETVIVENEYGFKHIPIEDDDFEPVQASNSSSSKCTCNQTKKEMELRQKKIKLILQEEEALYKMKKDEQQLKNEIAKMQLKILKEKKAYLAKKRKLQLQILNKQLDDGSVNVESDKDNMELDSSEAIASDRVDDPKSLNNEDGLNEIEIHEDDTNLNHTCVKTELPEPVSSNCVITNGKLENDVSSLRR